MSEIQEGDLQELRKYISEILLLISTGVESADMANIELAADNIYAKQSNILSEYKKTLK